MSEKQTQTTTAENQPTKKKILFICTANTCRSPMAQAIAQKQLDEKFPGQFECHSAGMKVDNNQLEFISLAGVNAVNNNGFGHANKDRLQHSYKLYNLNEFDKIYVMPAKYLNQLHNEYPNLKDKIQLYSIRSIPDPIDLEHFPNYWSHKDHPEDRTPDEIQYDYNHIAKKINDLYTPKIMERLEREMSPSKENTSLLR